MNLLLCCTEAPPCLGQVRERQNRGSSNPFLKSSAQFGAERSEPPFYKYMMLLFWSTVVHYCLPLWKEIIYKSLPHHIVQVMAQYTIVVIS